jgi:hypothetical protein
VDDARPELVGERDQAVDLGGCFIGRTRDPAEGGIDGLDRHAESVTTWTASSPPNMTWKPHRPTASNPAARLASIDSASASLSSEYGSARRTGAQLESTSMFTGVILA